MANSMDRLPRNTREALDTLKRRYDDLRTAVANSPNLPEPLYRMRRKKTKRQASRSFHVFL